jgi:HlyD family secretion protein
MFKKLLDMKGCYLSLVLAIMLVGCNSNPKTNEPAPARKGPETVTALGRVEPESKITEVGAEANGVIKKIYYHEGDTVAKGVVVVELKHDYEDALLAQAQAKLPTQQSEIQNCLAQINQAKVKQSNLKAKLDRITSMYKQSADTKQNVDNAQSDYDQSVLEVQRLGSALVTAQNKIAEIRSSIALAQADIQRRLVTAPADGIILNMDLTEGSGVSVDRVLFDLAPRAAPTVLCEVDELLVNKLKLGQRAVIRTEGMDDKLDEGVVTYLGNSLKKKSIFSNDSGNMEDRRVREVRIRLKGERPLLINSRVEAVITVE